MMKLSFLSATLGLLGAKAALVPCVNETTASSISQSMESGMASIASLASSIGVSCDSSSGFACNETDVVQVNSDILNAYINFDRLLYIYRDLSDGFIPRRCEPFDVFPCNCSAMFGNLTLLNQTYYEDYLPAWNEYVIGNVTDCSARATALGEMVDSIQCYLANISGNYEGCRLVCGLTCWDQSFAEQVNATLTAASFLINRVNANIAGSCSSGNYSCLAFNTYRTLRDVKIVGNLLNNTYNEILALYEIDALTFPCSVKVGRCDCGFNNQLIFAISLTINIALFAVGKLASPFLPESCSGVYQLLLFVYDAKCWLNQLILNYEVCLAQCACPDLDTLMIISDNMDEAMAYMDKVQVAYTAQCPGDFKCSTTNITLVQEDLTKAIAYYDLAIGNYTKIIQDTGFNSTCQPPIPECSCRLLGDQLRDVNVTYYLDYIPALEDYLGGFTTDCTQQAVLLRSIVLELKCIAISLLNDYTFCLRKCQTNWCLVYNCTACLPQARRRGNGGRPSFLRRFFGKADLTMDDVNEAYDVEGEDEFFVTLTASQ